MDFCLAQCNFSSHGKSHVCVLLLLYTFYYNRIIIVFILSCDRNCNLLYYVYCEIYRYSRILCRDAGIGIKYNSDFIPCT